MTTVPPPRRFPGYAHRLGAQSTLGRDIFAPKLCMKNEQNARILHDNCPKTIFPRILGARVPPASPPPTPRTPIPNTNNKRYQIRQRGRFPCTSSSI